MDAEAATQLSDLTSASGADSGGLRRVLWYGVLAGLCPLIPIPFLDDVIIKRLRKRMIRGQLTRAGLEPAGAQINLFTHEASQIRLLGCLFGAVWVVVKKVLRKLIYVFAIKDCVDNASRVVHHGWLVQYALNRGALDAQTLQHGNESIKRVRDAVLHASDNLDTRPFNQALKRLFRGSSALIKGAAVAVGRILRGADRRQVASLDQALDGLGEREVGEVERVLDEMVLELVGQKGYLRQLEQAFDETLESLGEPSAQKE